MATRSLIVPPRQVVLDAALLLVDDQPRHGAHRLLHVLGRIVAGPRLALLLKRAALDLRGAGRDAGGGGKTHLRGQGCPGAAPLSEAVLALVQGSSRM